MAELQNATDSGFGGTPGATLATALTGSAIAVFFAQNAGSVASVTDDQGQTYSLVASGTDGGTGLLECWVAPITAAGSTPTISVSGVIYSYSLVVAERDDVDGTASAVQSANASGSTGSPATISLATALASGVGNIGYFQILAATGSPYTPSGGFTITAAPGIMAVTYQDATVDNAIFTGSIAVGSACFYGDLSVVLAAGTGGSSSVHSGLTGQGSFVPSGAVAAIEIDIASIPIGLGTAQGLPARYFELGNVSFEYASAYATRNYFLQHQHEIVVTEFDAVTNVYYSFAGGVTATITEVASL